MDREKTWMDEQTVQVPLYDFIELKVSYEKMNSRYYELMRERNEAVESLAMAKKQIAELLGMNEGDDGK